MLYLFDNCELNTDLYTLKRAGQTTQLRPKVFRLLVYLIEHRNRVISKQELAEQVWPDQIISNGALESTVRLLRCALGDNGHVQRIVQTRHGHGYRFVMPVTRCHAAGTTTSPPQDERWRDVAWHESHPTGELSPSTFCIACGAQLWRCCPCCGTEHLSDPSSTRRRHLAATPQ